MRDRLDQALIAQDLNGPPCGIAGDSEQVHEVLLARQWILAGPERCADTIKALGQIPPEKGPSP